MEEGWGTVSKSSSPGQELAVSMPLRLASQFEQSLTREHQDRDWAVCLKKVL